MPSTFSIDPSHPSVLVCDQCREAVVTITPDGPAEHLTAQQASIRWPERAWDVREHSIACQWRRNPPLADGREGFIHFMERDEEG